jgi:hypothetical protein
LELGLTGADERRALLHCFNDLPKLLELRGKEVKQLLVITDDVADILEGTFNVLAGEFLFYGREYPHVRAAAPGVRAKRSAHRQFLAWSVQHVRE